MTQVIYIAKGSEYSIVRGSNGLAALVITGPGDNLVAEIEKAKSLLTRQSRVSKRNRPGQLRARLTI